MAENKASLPIPQTVMDNILKKLNEAQALIAPYVTPLSEKERHDLAKMGANTIDFVNKAKDYTITNPEFVPALYMNAGDLKIDVDNVNLTNPVENVARQLATSLSDMILLSGHEAVDGALEYYGSVRMAAHNNVPNSKEIYNDLAKRFPGRKKKKLIP